MVIPNYQIEVLLAVKTHLIMPSGKLVEQKNPSIYIYIQKKFNFDDKVKFLTERNKELLKSSLKVSKEKIYTYTIYVLVKSSPPLNIISLSLEKNERLTIFKTIDHK